MEAWLFDLDGTLIDSGDDIAASANYARGAVGLPPLPVARLRQFIGEGSLRLVERAVAEGGRVATRELVQEALAAWRRHYAEHLLDGTTLYSGVKEALETLGGPHAVVTNKPGVLARRLVEAFGLAQLCPVVIGGDDLPTRKPAPEPIWRAMERLGAERAVLVGDSAIDAAAARAAKVGFVGVLWGMCPREELEAHGARHLARHTSELAALCRQAMAEQP